MDTLVSIFLLIWIWVTQLCYLHQVISCTVLEYYVVLKKNNSPTNKWYSRHKRLSHEVFLASNKCDLFPEHHDKDLYATGRQELKFESLLCSRSTFISKLYSMPHPLCSLLWLALIFDVQLARGFWVTLHILRKHCPTSSSLMTHLQVVWSGGKPKHSCSRFIVRNCGKDGNRLKKKISTALEVS